MTDLTNLTKRPRPYLWATTVADLLVGDRMCEHYGWLRAHYFYEKYEAEPRGFDSASWNIAHAAMVRARAAQLREAGYTVKMEGQNKFKWSGRLADIAGQMDIVATLPTADGLSVDVLIVDCKTGRAKDSHVAQVGIYLNAARRCIKTHLPIGIVTGEVAYSLDDVTKNVQVSDESALAMRPILGYLVNRIAADVAPPTTPCAKECRFCDVPPTMCEDRVSGEDDTVVGSSDGWF